MAQKSIGYSALLLVVILLAMTTFAMARPQAADKGTSDKAGADQQRGRQSTPASDQTNNPTVKAGLKTKVFEIKYGDPEAIAHIIGPLGSGTAWAQTATSHQYRTITVRDFPENLAAIEEAINRLDKPEPAPQMLEFHIHILLASNELAEKAAQDDYSPEASQAIKQLQTTFKYKQYTEVASNVQLAAIGNIVDDSGVISARASEMLYSYSMTPISIDSSGGQDSIRINDFRFLMKLPPVVGGHGPEQVGFQSPLMLREGEEVVVGTTTVSEGGVVVVLVAKILH